MSSLVLIWSIWSDLHIERYLQNTRKHFGTVGFEGLNVKSFSQNLWENVEKSATTIWATRILVLLIGGSTGTMLEALEVVGGDNHNDSPFSSGGTITGFTNLPGTKSIQCYFKHHKMDPVKVPLPR